MCVWGLFWLVLLLKSHFCTQLAVQQIKPPSPESAEIQECMCVCFIQVLMPCIVCIVKQNLSGAKGSDGSDAEPRFFNWHMAQPYQLCNQ
jgi:hypothetical protein